MIVLAGAVAFVIVAHSQRVASGAAHGGHRTGDCVAVTSPPDEALHAVATSCDTDPSFTVGALADRAGNCSPPEAFQQFRPPFADSKTAKLCLVPNLVVNHCYKLGIPIGAFDLVDCARAGPAVTKVTKRLDVDDAHACPNGKYAFVMHYPSPPRTYCIGPTS